MKQCPQCGASFSAEAAFCVHDGTRLTETRGAEDPLIGKVIDGRYRIEKVIGKGGAGSVYEARHLLLPRKVALKFLLRARKADPDLVARFQQEVKAIVAVDHENIVGIYEVGHDKDAGYYVAMDRLEGVDLGTRIDEGERLDIQEVFAIAIGVCDALDAVHQHGIVHRDVKAPNIFLARDRKRPVGFVPKLLDFGIAKVVGRSAGLPGLDVTGDSRVVGTPTTMSPEQATGQKLDGRSDLYSAGVVLYEMLTRELPFTSADMRQMLLMHVNDPPVPPSRRIEGKWIPGELEQLVLSMLAKRPEDRPQRGREVVEALRRIRGRVYSAWASHHVTSTVDMQHPALHASNRVLNAVATHTGAPGALSERRRKLRPEGPPRVLVIDDEQPILELVQLVLERDRYRCFTVEGGEAAIAWLAENPLPDALIVDLMMPDIDGADCIRGARMMGFRGPAILFTTVEAANLHDAMRGDPGVIVCDKTRDLHRLSEVLAGAGVAH